MLSAAFALNIRRPKPSNHSMPAKRTATLALVGLALLTGAIAAQAQATNTTLLPDKVNLRPNFERWKLPLRKQGARPTCSVFASVSAMEYSVARARAHGVPLSVEFANWAGNRAIQRDQDGHFFWEIIKGYELKGICPEDDMPYAADFDANRTPSEKAIARAQELMSVKLQFHWIRPNDGKTGLDDHHIREIKATLANGWPVAAGSYHSILFVGYTDDQNLEGGGQFLVRDSGGGNEQVLTYAAAKIRICDAFWVESAAKVLPH